MSPLHLGLLAIGVLVIASVLIYNWWQERRIRRDMVRRFDGPIDDVLMGKQAEADPDSDEAFAMDNDGEMDEEDFEPELGDQMEDESADEVEVEEGEEEPEFTASEPDEIEADETDETEPTIEESALEEPEAEAVLLQEEEELAVEEDMDSIPTLVEAEAPVSALAEPATALPAGVDSQVDEIVTVAATKPVSGEELRKLLNTATNFGKPALWFGASQGEWLPLRLPLTADHAQRDFSRVVGALQLADRSGALQPKGWQAFQDQIEQLSAQLGGAAAWQEDRDVLQYAELLDRFCIDVDVTVRLHLAAGISGPFAGTKFRSLMEASGLSLKEDGRFHFANAEGETLFTIGNGDQQPLTDEGLRTSMMHDVLLMLDVPRVADASNIFKQMAMLGNRMETALNAKLTDAKQRTLGDAEIEQIRSQIKSIHSKMQERQLVPGSAPILRLFS